MTAVDAVDVEEEHPSRGSIGLYLMALGILAGPLVSLISLAWLWIATIPEHRVVYRTYVSYGPTMTSFRIWRMECVALEHQRQWDALLDELRSTRHAELRGRP